MTKALDHFVQPFGGTVEQFSDAERQATAETFSNIVSDLMMTHAGYISTENYVKYPNSSRVMLTIPLDDIGQRLHIVVRSEQTAVGSTDYDKSIFVRETDADNRTYRWHTYNLKFGQIDVVRSDYYSTPEELLEPLEDEYDEDEIMDFDYDMTEEEARDLEEQDRELMRESGFGELIQTDAMFQAQMGMNHLPVRQLEVTQLGELLQQAAPIRS